MCGVYQMKKFTLLELLIVIAIIGILASILLPSLSKARERTLSAVCLSNQSQIGKGLYMYANENSGTFPTGGGSLDYLSLGPEALWTISNEFIGLGKLYQSQILDSEQALFCPAADLLKERGQYGWQNYENNDGHVASSYVLRSSYDTKRALTLADNNNLSVVADWFMYRQESKGVNHIELKGMNVLYWDGSAKFIQKDFNTLINIPTAHIDWDGNEQVWDLLGY